MPLAMTLVGRIRGTRRNETVGVKLSLGHYSNISFMIDRVNQRLPSLFLFLVGLRSESEKAGVIGRDVVYREDRASLSV